MKNKKVTIRTKITPPELAARWGIDWHKVIAWIRSGELRAIDASTRPGGRPRFLIDERDIELFELRRSVISSPKPIRRRRQQNQDIIQYF